MAAAMDVDVATDVGTSADRPGGKKRFEVKKVSITQLSLVV